MPDDSVSAGSAAAVAMAAPVTFVANVRCHVAASVSARRASGPIAGV